MPRALSDRDAATYSVAVLIPCRDEELSVERVVRDFHSALPNADIHVYDNSSADDTRSVAAAAGAITHSEPIPGKGNVVRRMFADVEADIYVLVDGDDTYDAKSAPLLIERLLADGLDMVNAARVPAGPNTYRTGHALGNRVLTGIVARIFGNRFGDMLSGYRVVSRRFAKSFPTLVRGFEIETELTVHALELRMPVDEIRAPYRERPAGSESKLHTLRDGWRILWIILVLIKEERPLPFFSILFGLLGTASLVLAWPILITFIETGLVLRLPTAVLATGMMIVAFLGLACGLILDTVTRARREIKRLIYLSIPGPAVRSVERLKRGD